MSELTPFTDDDSALDADERRLLRAGRDLGVPRGAKRAVWGALAAAVPTVAAASSATTGVLTVASLVKYGAVGVLLGATTMTTVTVMRSSGHVPASPAATAAVTPTPPAPLAVEGPQVNAPPVGVTPPLRSAAPLPGERPSAPSTAAAAPVRSEVVPSDTESRRVAAARALQRSGRTREALAALDAIASDLPNGELVQEREALAIEALLTLGDRASARQRATAFVQRFPGSPHTASARRALE